MEDTQFKHGVYRDASMYGCTRLMMNPDEENGGSECSDASHCSQALGLGVAIASEISVIES